MKIFLSMLVCLFVMSMPSAVVSAAEVQTTEDGKFTYSCNYYDETATIHEYLGEETVVTFPSEIDGCKVTAIFKGRYQSNFTNPDSPYMTCVLNEVAKETVTKIVIPNTVKKIGNYAFEDCTALETVQMSTKIESVGGCAFENCTALKEISFPKTLKEFGRAETKVNYYDNYAGPFKGCTALEKVTIDSKAKLTSIPENSFRDCTSLKKVTLPNKLTSIGSCAFISCKELTSVNFPSALKLIGDNAFNSCVKLTSVKFGSKLETIRSWAFANTGIKKVTIPKNVSVWNSAFNGCKNLKSAVINKGIESSGEIFSGCTSLEKVTINSGVTSIPAGAFAGTALKTVVIPKSVTSIGNNAFGNCSKLSKVFILNDSIEMGGFTSGSKVRLYGYKNSTVQTYAKQVGVRFKALTTVKSLKAKNSSKGKVKLTWKKVSGVKTYTVYRSTSKNGTYKKIGTTKKLNFTDKKAKKGKTYYYRITIDYEDSTGIKLTGVKSSSVKIKVKK